MRHASLFSGIGGFDLAAEWMGWENVMQCEIDPFCQRVLRHHFPSAHLYGDIRQIDGTTWRGKIDILTGGFPCQPFSAAGKRRGTEDDRHLWPEMLRIIRESRPTWIVAENVRGLLTIDDGLVFESVWTDLEGEGYEVQPFVIPACSVNAPHRRDRLWIIAHRTGAGLEGWEWESLQKGSNGPSSNDCAAPDSNKPETNTEHERPGRPGQRGWNTVDTWQQATRQEDWKTGNNKHLRCWEESWIEAATRLCRVDDGLPRGLDGITVPRWRRESLKGYGNAIVPQVALEIFKAISISF